MKHKKPVITLTNEMSIHKASNYNNNSGCNEKYFEGVAITSDWTERKMAWSAPVKLNRKKVS